MNTMSEQTIIDEIARNDLHFPQAPQAFFHAWKRGVDFLKATGRGTSGRDYEALMAALKRLRGVTISTNIGSSSRRGQVFGLIEGGDIIEKDGRGRMVNIEIVLSDWILRQITDLNVLTN